MKLEPYAKLLKASGEIVDVRPKDGRAFSLVELQGFVGGHIEMVRTPADRVLVCHEEGKFMGYGLNVAATQKYHPGADVIVGDVLICDDDYLEK